MPSKLRFPENKPLIIAVIADEDTMTGFLLTGFGQNTPSKGLNYYIPDKKNPDLDKEMGDTMKAWIMDGNFGIIMI